MEALAQENEVNIKNILCQYCDMRKEIEDKKLNYAKLEAEKAAQKAAAAAAPPPVKPAANAEDKQ